MSIKLRLIGGFLGIAFLVAITGAIAVLEQLQTAEQAAIVEAKNIGETIGLAVVARDQENLQSFITRLHASQQRDVEVVDLNKRILADAVPEDVGTILTHDTGNEVGLTMQDGQVRTFVEISPEYPRGISQLVVPLKDQEGKIIGAVIVEYTALYEELQSAAEATGRTIAIYTFACVILALALGYFVSTSISGPILKLRDAAVKIEQGELNVPFPRMGRDEIGQLVASFAHMTDQLLQTQIGLEQRVAERTAELSVSEARFRGLFEHAPVSIWEEDFSAVRQYIEGLRAAGIVDFSAYFDAHPEAVTESATRVKIVDVNFATLEMFQAESKTQLLEDLSKVLGPESLVPFKEELLALARGETSYENETTNYTMRGERRAVFVRLTVAPGSEQTWVQVFVGISDITERRQAEAALAGERDLLQALMDNIPDTIYFKDIVSRFIRINRAQVKVLGVAAAEEAIGKTDSDFFQDAALVQSFHDEEQRIIETGEPLINRIEFNPTPEGKPRWFSATKVPIKDPDGHVIGIVGVSRDITALKQAEDALREAEIKYRTLVEHLPAIVYLDQYDQTVTAGYRPVYISPQVEIILGYRPDEFIEDPDLWPSLLHPDDRERVLAAEALHYEAGKLLHQEYHIIARDGHVVWLRDEAVMIRDEATGRTFSQGVLLDITARKQAEEALSQSEERFRLMSWATKDAVWDWDLQKNQIWWGAGLQKIFHYSSETVETNSEWWLDRIHPEDRAKVNRVISQAAEGGMEFWSKEYRFQRVDGTYANIMDRAYIIRDTAGKAYRMVGAMMDITDRKQAEQALLASETRYRQIVETAGDIIYRIDLEGNLTYVNPTALRVIGYKTEAEILGRQYLEFVHPAWRQYIKFTYDQQLAEKTLNTYQEFLAFTRDRKEIWLGQTVQIVMENDNIIGFQAVARDITSQKEAEAALQELNGRMAQSLNEIQQRNRETALLNELSHMLQSCQSAPEAYGIIAELSKQLFPQTAGAIYLLSESQTQINAIASWGKLSSTGEMFNRDNCKALRRSPTRQLNVDQLGMCCLYFAQQPSVTYCLPIQVQGETLGIFHLRSTSEENLPENKRQLAYTVVEQSEMALSNLKLREALLEQSIRDPLTELYNRRYMEEALNQQLSRVTRQLHPLGLIMIDIDLCKNFNDTHGHAAGDSLLRELGRLLQSHIRGGDVACRYGGEEFLLIMPDASLEAAHQRAVLLQQEAKKLRVQDVGQSLDGITLSLGVAIYPEHGRSIDSVLRAADAALYRAKQEGRDRVVVAERAY